MHRSLSISRVEERLAQTIGPARTGKALVEQDGTVRHRLVEFLEGRVTVLTPLVGMPAAHRGNPLALGYVRAARRKRLLDFADRGRVLKDRVVAGAVGQAHAVNVGFDDSRNDRTTTQIDDLVVGFSGPRGIPDRNEAAIADRNCVGYRLVRIHGMDLSIDERQRCLFVACSGRLNPPADKTGTARAPSAIAAPALAPRNCRRRHRVLRFLVSGRAATRRLLHRCSPKCFQVGIYRALNLGARKGVE